MYTDTHFHLMKEDYEDIDLVVKEANNNKVSKLIISGCDKKSIIEGLEYINKYDNVYMTVGFHPEYCEEVSSNDIVWLEKLINENKKIVGIGEVGLDYYYTKGNKVRQMQLFKQQLDLAQKLKMPIVIHSRDAFMDTYETLKQYKLKGVIHCFTSNIENARRYIDLGYYLGIGGVLTFKNSNLKDVISKIDLDHIVLETDSPYLSPEPLRGKVNGPKNIPLIATKIEEIKKIPIEVVASITTSNARELFDLNM